MSHNPLFTTFVDNQPNPILGYVAYGIYKESKRQWIVQETAAKGGTAPTPSEVASHVSGYTPAIQSSFIASAESALSAFADEAILAAKPAIVEEALKGSTLSAVGVGLVTNVIYTLILIALVLVLKFAGVDILGIFGAAKS